MSTPRFYCWDDAYSPGRNLTGNLQNRLKQILVPCLVTGYGDKPGAGWTIGHEHPNGFSLINADGNVVNFVSNLPAQAPYPAIDSQALHIYAASSLSGTQGAIIEGAGLCSGEYREGFSDNKSRHMWPYAEYPLTINVSTLQWSIVADTETFILNCSIAQSSNSSGSSGTSGSLSLYCGVALLDTGITESFIVLGGGIYPYADTGVVYAFCKGYSCPIHPVTGLSGQVVLGAAPYIDSPETNPTATYHANVSRLNFQQPRIVCNGVFVGRLRGVLYDDLIRTYAGWRPHLKALGFSGEDFNDRGKLVKIDGHNYAFARSYSGNSYLTDNPAFW